MVTGAAADEAFWSCHGSDAQVNEPSRTQPRPRLPIVSALVLLAACVAACQSSSHGASTNTTTTASTVSSGGAAWVLYRDPSGVSFSRQTSWTVVPGQEGPLVVYLDPATGVPFRRNINILHQIEPRSVTLSEYTAVTKQELQSISDFVQTSLGPVALSGQPGMRIVYSATLPGLSSRLEVLSEWTVIGGKPWLVTYTSDPSRFEQLAASAQRLIDSIRLPGPS